jgi:ethanolamine ammonia-lyase small subunit
VSAPDPWWDLRQLTAARIALGRSGASLPTVPWLQFAQAHAMARDAVHSSFDTTVLESALRAAGIETHHVASAVPDRATYLRRPDLGRRLAAESARRLAALPQRPRELVVMVGDGLSPLAAATHAAPLVQVLDALALSGAGLRLEAVVIASQARVALGDEVGALLGAQAVLVLIGERPGLSSPDSLGAYLTWAPCLGRSDAERNCVSNIRPAGLPPAAAAARLAWLLGAAQRLGATGLALKDESDRPVLP